MGTQRLKGYPGRWCVNDDVESVWAFCSDARFIWFGPPKHIVLDQRVQDREQLPHGCGERYFFRFPLTQQVLVKGFDSGVESRGYQRCHVKYATDIRAAAERPAFASEFSGIAVHRSHSDKLGNLSTAELSKFRQLR